MKCEKCGSEAADEKSGKAYFDERLPDMSVETKELLEKTYYSFLCRDCLKKIDDLVAEAEKMKASGEQSCLKEGTHYYMQKGNLVFTEFYHILKGYCCQNLCKHCAYGFSLAMNPDRSS
jgi:hypothetical protein